MRRLLKGFLNHQRTVSIHKYLKVLSIKNNQTIKEMGSILNYDRSSIEEAFLRKFKHFGFFEIKGKGVNRHLYRFSITKEGKLFLKTVKTCELWLKYSRRNNER